LNSHGWTRRGSENVIDGAAQIFSAILEHLGSATLDVLDPGVSF
jgi:hypothetical protein